MLRVLQGRALDGLKVLKKKRVNTKVLAETQAGKLVKALAKHPKADVAAAAADVVAAWKDVVRREAGGSGGGSAAAAASTASGAPSSSKQAASGQQAKEATSRQARNKLACLATSRQLAGSSRKQGNT